MLVGFSSMSKGISLVVNVMYGAGCGVILNFC